MKKRKRFLTGDECSLFRRILKIMKLTAIILFSTTMLVSASLYSQSTRLTLMFTDITYGELFEEIENQSEFRFAFSSSKLDPSQKVQINVKKRSLEEILDKVLPDEIAYEIIDRYVVILNASDKKSTTESQQQKNITGKVTDEAGQPLPGVTVVIKGTTQGTVTNTDGNYSILNIPENATLVFSFVGMRTQEVDVDNQTSINVTMQVDAIGIEEVVAIGYGTQKKMNVTGSVASVSGEKLENRPLPNVGEVLRGISPNLNIGLSNWGGEPGASREWNIRGLGSLSGNDSPLILVDGVEMDINNLDPQNIESVSVLKDASASAIYGARAPFGVVLITTKRGKKGQGIRIQYNNILTFGTALGVQHQENSLKFVTAYNQASVNAGSAPYFSDELVERVKGFIDGTYPYEYDLDNPPNSVWAGRRVGNGNWDWPHEYLKKFKLDQKHSVNVSGGNDKTQFYISLGFYDEEGIWSVGYDDYKRYDVLANFTSEITDWIRFDFSTKYANSLTDYPHGITTVERRYFLTNLYLFGPNQPKYNVNGSPANAMFISIGDDAGRNKTTKNDLLVTVGGELEPVKGWKTNISFNYNVAGTYGESTPKPIWVELGNGKFGNVGKPGAAYEATFSHSAYSLFNVVTTYEKTLGNHYFKALAGFEQEQKFYSWLYARGDDLITTEIPSISTALGSTTVDDTKWDWATQGVFGRLNYNFKEKYLIEFSARYNGSSRFAPESRWGFFPSASAGYQISKENFWEPLETYVNRLKIRASYGSLGNQNVSNYLYIPSIPIGNETPWILGGERPPYAQTPGLISESLTWETITTSNFGVDAAFLNNRLELNFDWFNRVTTHMFGPQETLPYTLGTSTPKANNAELETKGFELMLSWKDKVSSDFSYNAQISVGDAKSTILEYMNESGFINGWYDGKEVGEIWGFVTDGIMQTEAEVAAMPDQSAIHPTWRPGDMKYKDLTGDGKITKGTRTLDDHGDLTVIGNTTPRYNIGIMGGFNWKGFDFNMQWLGFGKHDYLPAINNVTFWGLTHSWSNSAVLVDAPVLDYWRPADETNMFGPNTDAYFAKPYFNRETYKNKENQSKYILNAAYLRLKNVQFGYTVPQNLSKKIFLQKARIYISGENLLTIKNLPKTIDPEQTIGAGYTNSGGFYPIARSFSLGLNLTF